MDLEQKRALLDVSLERAADTLGDITPHVMSLYYQRHPDAIADFDRLSPKGRAALEQQMVEQSLYAIMDWLRASAEVEVVFLNAVPHHAAVLDIRPDLFSELLTAVCDTLIGTIPNDCADELALWRELKSAMTALVKTCARRVVTAR